MGRNRSLSLQLLDGIVKLRKEVRWSYINFQKVLFGSGRYTKISSTLMRLWR
jgi:hypothetical protein